MNYFLYLLHEASHELLRREIGNFAKGSYFVLIIFRGEANWIFSFNLVKSMHLSALLKEGDSVVYQTGTWDIDGVEVGDGSPATIRYATVIDIQLVWTHNCEHGVICALDMELLPNDEDDNHHCQRLAVSTPLKDVEFGPDQLIARIPIEWDDFDRDFYSYQGREGGALLVALPNKLITIK